MGSASAAKTRKEAVISALDKKIKSALKAVKDLDSFVLEIYTGYRIELQNEIAKVVEIKEQEELKTKPWCLTITVTKHQRNGIDQVFVGLTSILPVPLDVIIDRDEQRFEYNYDNFLAESQASVERWITGDKDALERNLQDLIKESQRILLLYGDEKIDEVKESQIK